MFLQGQQVVLPYDHPEYIPVPAGPIHLMTLHQYVNFGQVFVPTWWEHNPTFPLEISGLLIGNMGGFLPKDPRWMELQEKRHYHNWIIQLTRQAAALEDRETVVNNWYRLQYLHSGEKPWQEGDFLQGATRPNDLSLPHVVNNLNGCIRKMACHQMQGVHGLTEHIGKTVQMLNKVTYIMNGRYCSMPVQPPPALPPPEVSITNPSSSSPQQSPSNNSSRPVPTAERAVSVREKRGNFIQKHEYSRGDRPKSPFIEYHRDSRRNEWDDLPLSEETFTVDELLNVLQVGLLSQTGERRQRFYGPWQRGGARQTWMIDATNLGEIGAETVRTEEQMGSGYDVNNVWFKYKDQYYVDSKFWRLDVSVVTVDSMAYIKDMCRQYAEWEMTRSSKMFLLYKTNHPMVFVFILVIGFGTIHKGFIIFHGRNINYVPYAVFKTPHGPFKKNAMTPMMEQAKWDPKRPFYEYMRKFHEMTEAHLENLEVAPPPAKFVPSRAAVCTVIAQLRKRMKEWNEEYAEEDEPQQKRVCCGLTDRGLLPAPPQVFSRQAAKQKTTVAAQQQPQVIQTHHFLQPAPVQLTAPPRKNAVCYHDPPVVVAPPAPLPVTQPAQLDQEDDDYSEDDEILQYGPPSPMALEGNSPPPPAQPAPQETEEQQLYGSQGSVPMIPSDEQFDPPQLSPLPFNQPGYGPPPPQTYLNYCPPTYHIHPHMEASQSLPSGSPAPSAYAGMLQRTQSVQPTTDPEPFFPPLQSWFNPQQSENLYEEI